jgi:ribA/ribD-fused uncharacterized protein
MRFDGTEYAFLSNFYPSEIVILDGMEPKTYSTVEHAYQTAKTLDKEEREKIRTASTPGLAKSMGQKCKLRDDWEEVKDKIMLFCLKKKFEIPELKQKLMETGDAHLVEGNTWHDNHFGVCVCIKCGSVGKNILGTLLMQVRDEGDILA